jgi:undecaprenyl-diphosphatase
MDLIKKIVIGAAVYAVALLFLEHVIIFDDYLLLAINSISNILLDPIFVMITYMGSSVFWILATVLFWIKGKKKISLYLIIAFMIDSLSLFLLKSFFIRPRPFENFSNLKVLNFEVDIGPSFPSGHTQRAFSGATILGSFYKKFSTAFFIISLLVGISRIYIGVHYPFDVLAGAINGVLIGFVTMALPIKKIKKKLEKL